MARKKLKTVKVGRRCSVTIYRDSYAGEYVVQSVINGKTVGGKKDGGSFNDTMADARAAAAANARWLRKRPACR
jgi:hypothetical protein